jgi:hypothetical protein
LTADHAENFKSDVVGTLIGIVGGGFVLWILLTLAGWVHIVEQNDLSNSFTLTIEIILGLLIASLLFYYDRKLRRTLESDRQKQVKVFEDLIMSALRGLHFTAVNISHNLALAGLPDNVKYEELEKPQHQFIRMAKLNFNVMLQQFQILITIGSPMLNTDLVRALLELHVDMAIRTDPQSQFALRWKGVYSIIEERTREIFSDFVKALVENREFMEKGIEEMKDNA